MPKSSGRKSKYDEYAEQFEQIESPTYWPTVEDIDLMEKEPDKWILFCAFLLEHNNEPLTNEEKYSKKNLSKFVNNYLELIDNEDEIENDKVNKEE